jgi:hypothetical protein
MNKNKYAFYMRGIFLLASISTVVLLSISQIAKADSINTGVYPKDSSPFGVPYGVWLTKWWQWNMGIPSAEHPRDHYTPSRCAIDQSGPVWFLADLLSGKEERTCNIPFGKAILVPLLTGNCDADGTTPNAPASESDPNLIQCAKAGNEYGAISASLDGKELQNLAKYRTLTGFFNLVVPKDNVFHNRPGTWRSVNDGYFVFLEPLPVGSHELHLKTNVINPINPSYNYSADLIYHLIVTPRP